MVISGSAALPVILNADSRTPSFALSAALSSDYPPLHVLFQSNQRDSLHKDTEPDANTVESPLKCTLTAQILVHWVEHIGATSHIGLKCSVEMLHLQCAQRFPAGPANSADSVFAELFPAGKSPCHRRKKNVWSLSPTLFSI